MVFLQELHDKFGTLEVTTAYNFDPTRVIQELRRLCIKLDVLGDKVVPSRKTHAFLKSLPDKPYGSFKTVLLCERPSGGGVAMDFEGVANRAKSYHAMQIRGKVSSNDDSTGSHGRALNTACTEEHVVSAGEADVDKEEVVAGMAAGPRTVTTTRRTITTAMASSTRTGTHTG